MIKPDYARLNSPLIDEWVSTKTNDFLPICLKTLLLLLLCKLDWILRSNKKLSKNILLLIIIIVYSIIQYSSSLHTFHFSSLYFGFFLWFIHFSFVCRSASFCSRHLNHLLSPRVYAFLFYYEYKMENDSEIAESMNET